MMWLWVHLQIHDALWRCEERWAARSSFPCVCFMCKVPEPPELCTVRTDSGKVFILSISSSMEKATCFVL